MAPRANDRFRTLLAAGVLLLGLGTFARGGSGAEVREASPASAPVTAAVRGEGAEVADPVPVASQSRSTHRVRGFHKLRLLNAPRERV